MLLTYSRGLAPQPGIKPTLRSPVISHSEVSSLVRRGLLETLEGADFDGRLVIVRFLDIDHARAFYHSPEYQELIKLRAPAAIGEIVIGEGFE
ncbi:MAG: DUF1330 domain-containing protein [Burkholderiales bacterium]|nr:DUF1330 domain-containing protein [Burkholderiales bacterium]